MILSKLSIGAALAFCQYGVLKKYFTYMRNIKKKRIFAV